MELAPPGELVFRMILALWLDAQPCLLPLGSPSTRPAPKALPLENSCGLPHLNQLTIWPSTALACYSLQAVATQRGLHGRNSIKNGMEGKHGKPGGPIVLTGLILVSAPTLFTAVPSPRTRVYSSSGLLISRCLSLLRLFTIRKHSSHRMVRGPLMLPHT